MLRRFIILFIICSFSFAGQGATGDYEKVYREYRDVSTRDLLAQSSVAFNSGDHERALAVLAALITRIGDSTAEDDLYVLARAYNNLGLVYFYNFTDYSRAHDYFLQSYGLAQQHEFADLLPAVHLNLANVYAEIDDYGNAMEHYRMAFSLGHTRQEENNVRNAAVAFINLLGTATDADSVSSTLPDMLEMERWHPATDVPPIGYARVMGRGMRHALEGRTEQALATLDSLDSLAPADMHGSERFVLVRILSQAYVLEKAGRPVEALGLTSEAPKLTAMYGNMPDVDIDILTMASRLYTRLGRPAEALAVRQRVLDLQDSILSNKRVNLIHESVANFTMERFNAYARTMESRKRRDMAITWGVIVLALAAAGVATLIWRKNRRLAQKNRDLYRIYIESTRKAEPEVEAVDDEQKRLVSEIIRVMESSPEIFNPGFSLSDLAALVDARAAAVSTAINEGMKVGFPALLADYRVREASRRISRPGYMEQITIEALAGELGFKSRTNFSAVFKRITGMTPTEFYKNARRSQSAD